MPTTFIAKGADGYDQFMGRWSARLAPLFLDFAGAADGERIVDVGCGTGSLTFLIAARANAAAIEAIDFEEQFVEALRPAKHRSADIRAPGRCMCAAVRRQSIRPRAVHARSAFRIGRASSGGRDAARGAARRRRRSDRLGYVWRDAEPAQCSGIHSPRLSQLRSKGAVAALVRPMTFPGEMTNAFNAAGLRTDRRSHL